MVLCCNKKLEHCSRLIGQLQLVDMFTEETNDKEFASKKIAFGLILLIIGYHVIFGGARILIDFKYPSGSCDNTVVAWGKSEKCNIFNTTREQ